MMAGVVVPTVKRPAIVEVPMATLPLLSILILSAPEAPVPKRMLLVEVTERDVLLIMSIAPVEVTVNPEPVERVPRFEKARLRSVIVVVLEPELEIARFPPERVSLDDGPVVPMPMLPPAGTQRVLVPTTRPPPMVVVAEVP